jgi:hypothetical protein
MRDKRMDLLDGIDLAVENPRWAGMALRNACL